MQHEVAILFSWKARLSLVVFRQGGGNRTTLQELFLVEYHATWSPLSVYFGVGDRPETSHYEPSLSKIRHTNN